MIEWIAENKEWFLEGLGIFLLGLVVAFIGWLVRRKNSSSNGDINQSMGNNTKAGNITFKNNKQIVNGKSDNREE